MAGKYWLVLCIVFSLSLETFADETFYNEVAFSIGMGNVSFTEQAKSLEGDNVDEAGAGASIMILGNIKYDFMHKINKNFYLNGTFPLIPSADMTYFSVSSGAVFYLNNLSTKLGLQHSGTTVNFLPKFRYYWGIDVGVGYLVYQTETAKKSDILFEFGPMGGVKYAFSDDYIIEGNILVKKGVGVVTDTMNISVFIGGTFFLDWF